MTEHDPTATDPTPDELPPKPAIEDMPSDADVESAPEPGYEPVEDREYLTPDEAAEDDTIDDGETPEP